MSTTEQTEPQTETMSRGETVYRVTAPELLRFREEGDAAPVLEGRMMPYGQWTEIRSTIEGNFLERFEPGSLAKTMKERAHRIRVLFEHGLDRSFGRQTIAEIDELRDEQDGAYFRSTLLEGLPPLMVAGLRRGLYGSSVRFDPVKWDRVRFPKRSDHNPEGLEERTIRESHIREVSVTAFPAYEGATATVRSLTDEVATDRLLMDPARLAELIMARTEPQHSVREEPEPEPAPEPEPEPEAPERSRSTQPTRDYLKPQKGEPTWLL